MLSQPIAMLRSAFGWNGTGRSRAAEAFPAASKQLSQDTRGAKAHQRVPTDIASLWAWMVRVVELSRGRLGGRDASTAGFAAIWLKTLSLSLRGFTTKLANQRAAP